MSYKKLNKTVNEILKAEKECIGYEVRCQCCEGKLRKNNVCENCEEEVAPAESVNYPIFEYKEINLQDLLLALNKKGIEFEFNDKGKLITYYTGINREIKVGCIFLDLETTLSKQKPEVINKLIEILSCYYL